MSTMFLPRPIDATLLAEHREVWPSIPDAKRYEICVHCGHYAFERDVNYDRCYVAGCTCSSSNPNRDEELSVEHMLSSWKAGEMSQSLLDTHDLDREKWFARHSQDATFVSLRIKSKHAALACAFYDALADGGFFTLVEPSESVIDTSLDAVTYTTSFGNESRKTLKFHLKAEHTQIVLDYSAALCDGASIWLVDTDVLPRQPLAVTGDEEQPSSFEDDECPF